MKTKIIPSISSVDGTPKMIIGFTDNNFKSKARYCRYLKMIFPNLNMSDLIKKTIQVYH